MKGKVYLVGSGPGDPGLITVKGLNCILKADVIVYDFLASPVLVNQNSTNAELIYVGKRSSDHTLSQDKINELLVSKAKQGKIVTRLKGGDPFIFGRGGEEAEILAQEHIPFEIVPGISSGIAAPTYAGIPLSHRQYTSTISFITGHEDPTKESTNINWASLAKGIGTLVFFMGVKNLKNIIQNLIQNGKSPQTPVAIIRWGTTPKQTTIYGTCQDIEQKVRTAGLKPPAIIVIGEVVELRKNLNWFESRPLFGKTIVVTRARNQASDIVNLLTQAGANCIECPTIKVAPPLEWEEIDKAIDNISTYDWLVFTSVNGVLYFFERLYLKNKDVRILGHIKTACIGPQTANQLRTYGITTDVLPKTYQAESVVDSFKNIEITGKKILLPRAEQARPILPVELKKMGAVVDEITVYRTLPVFENKEDLLENLENNSIDIITFTSSSTVTNFIKMLPEDKFSDLMKNVTCASIGPITADTAKKHNIDIQIIADEFTINGLYNAILNYYK